MSDLISRRDAIDGVDDTDWYHQNKNGEMVRGANPSDHQAWYKAEDIYNVLESLPTAEPAWTIEEVAEILANFTGDECACNFNGIDEWLPERCKYAESTCPNPKEKHGCWKQFLLQGGTDMRGEKDR